MLLQLGTQKHSADHDEYIGNLTKFSLWLQWEVFLVLGEQQYQNVCPPEGVISWPIWPSEQPTMIELENEFRRLDEDHWLLGVKPGTYGSRLQFPSPCWASLELNSLQSVKRIIKYLDEYENQWKEWGSLAPAQNRCLLCDGDAANHALLHLWKQRTRAPNTMQTPDDGWTRNILPL